MNTKSRISNSSRNIFLGIFQQVVSLLLTFITRTIFIKFLNVELLGVNSLFSNILTVLSLADLGFGTAILYSMYRPLAEGDEKKLSALMGYFKKIYMIVATVVLVLGVAIIPFLKYLIKENNIEHIYLYYILFLLDTVASYLLAYKVNIINADQKNYIIKRYTLIFNIIKAVLQCMVIIIFKNFVLYILVQILTTLGINAYGAYVSKKLYPFLKKKESLSNDEKKNIMKNVKSLFVYKMGGIILNNTDNILISSMIGIACVGYYTNYSTIITAITSITAILFTTVTYSVGNLIATESKEKQIDIFYKIEFFCNLLISFISICLIGLINDLIKCWIGAEFLLDNNTIIAIVINFYMVGIQNNIYMFRDTTGLFNDIKYAVIITAILNIIFSIILGKIYGLFGIIFATAISRILTCFWYEPLMLHKIYFKTSAQKYFINRMTNVFLTIIISIFICGVSKVFVVNSWTLLVIKTIIISIIAGALLLIVYCRYDEFKYYIELIKTFVKNKIVKE